MEPGVLYLGCGNQTELDSLVIRWPDGTGVTLRGVGTNETLTLKQEEAPKIEVPTYAFPSLNVLQSFDPHFPVALDAQQNLPEKLQPWSLTDDGPKPAVSDNWAFVPGNEGGDLYRIQPDGMLQLVQSLPFAGQGICAAFADVDGDQQEDLYIGTAPSSTNSDGKDHLFKQRNGQWVLIPEALPVSPTNTGCVAFADVDGDGDMDLFAGGRSDMSGYGAAPASYLLENDGKGQFRDITDAKAPKLNRLGMLTGAWFGDMNNDQAPDLVLCGEWMPIHIFYNVSGVLTGMSIPESSGLWYSLSVADLDGDGDLDIVAGNFGTNSILEASRAQPLELWVKDFDQNMKVDPVLAYYRNQEQRPLWDKDLLISQMPFLKKRYVSYHKYAQDKMGQIFDATMQKDTKILRVERLQSSYFEQGKSGLWNISALSAPFQWSTINALATAELDGQPGLDLWVGGNTFQVNPTIGRMDALPLTHAANMGKGQFVPILTDFSIQGAVRAIVPHREGKALIVMSDGRVFVVAI
jgi:enediyne biosynthesis protein E4